MEELQNLEGDELELALMKIALYKNSSNAKGLEKKFEKFKRDFYVSKIKKSEFVFRKLPSLGS